MGSQIYDLLTNGAYKDHYEIFIFFFFNNSFLYSDAAIAKHNSSYLQTTVQRLLSSRGSTEDIRKSVNQ